MENMWNRKVNKWNILFMILGNLVLGLGVAVFKLSGLGNDPYTGMVMALGERIGMKYTDLLIVLNGVLFLLQITMGRRFIGVGTFVNAFLQGYVVMFFYHLVSRLGEPVLLWHRLVIVVIGLCIGGTGLAMYQNANAGTAPYDSVSLMLHDCSHKSYFGCRMFTDLICVVICFACGGIVNIGTVVNALLIGPVADLIHCKVVRKIMGASDRNEKKSGKREIKLAAE